MSYGQKAFIVRSRATGCRTPSRWTLGWCTTGIVSLRLYQLLPRRFRSLLLVQLMMHADVNLVGLTRQYTASCGVRYISVTSRRIKHASVLSLCFTTLLRADSCAARKLLFIGLWVHFRRRNSHFELRMTTWTENAFVMLFVDAVDSICWVLNVCLETAYHDIKNSKY